MAGGTPWDHIQVSSDHHVHPSWYESQYHHHSELNLWVRMQETVLQLCRPLDSLRYLEFGHRHAHVISWYKAASLVRGAHNWDEIIHVHSLISRHALHPTFSPVREVSLALNISSIPNHTMFRPHASHVRLFSLHLLDFIVTSQKGTNVNLKKDTTGWFHFFF